MWCSAGVQLEVHEPTVKRMQEHYAKSGKELNEARLRMARLPKGAEVCAHSFCTGLLVQYAQSELCT